MLVYTPSTAPLHRAKTRSRGIGAGLTANAARNERPSPAAPSEDTEGECRRREARRAGTAFPFDGHRAGPRADCRLTRAGVRALSRQPRLPAHPPTLRPGSLGMHGVRKVGQQGGGVPHMGREGRIAVFDIVRAYALREERAFRISPHYVK